MKEDSLENKIILITGATSGIGKETALKLANLGKTIIFTARNAKQGKKTRDDIRQATNNDEVHMLPCDLSSFKSIRTTCKDFTGKFNRLDVLINNAGIWTKKRQFSRDGIEMIFAVNYLAPFLMTNLLLDVLIQSKPSRVINVTSGLHFGTINFKDIEFKKRFSGMKAYKQSKLCLILFTRFLAKQLEDTGVSINCISPGMTKTNLAKETGLMSKVMFELRGKDSCYAAESLIYLAISSNVKNISGEYFTKNKIKKSSKQSYDMRLAKKLWDLSEEYCKL